MTTILQYWRELGCALAILFAALFFRAQGALNQCRDAASVVPVTTLAQEQKGDAKATVKVVYKVIPGEPCPQVTTETTTEAVHWQSQALTNTPSVASVAPRKPSDGVFIGGGYLGTPYVQAGFQIWSLAPYAITTGQIHGGGVTWRF